MKKILFSPKAKSDLDSIWAYSEAKWGEEQAEKYIRQIFTTILAYKGIAPMVQFLTLEDNNPALACSPMLNAALKIFAYIEDKGAIGLTPSKAFKRYFVEWAVKEFNWPDYTPEDLYAVNKVLNEMDFPPLADLHKLLLELKIGRHYKAAFKPTKQSKDLIKHAGQLFTAITPYYLFEFVPDWPYQSRSVPLGNWRIFLNILDREAEHGILGHDLRHILYGEPPATQIYDSIFGDLYVRVLRPLCWCGLLEERHEQAKYGRVNSLFTKTALWRETVRVYKYRDDCLRKPKPSRYSLSP